jgi:hypothetical protein
LWFGLFYYNYPIVDMMERNPEFDTAAEFVNNTSRPIFLTGKAGTGKTTFLKYIRENTKKKCVVVAPTGVAAMNAGGVTMHSMFQLPFSPYIPISQRSVSEGVTDKHTLFKNLRISQEKRDIIRDLDLIIIDEVSMVRCDTLDAMDVILRYVRGRANKPFGGIQVLFIGDLFQLPPVMPEGEWSVLRDYYDSPFFFHSKVIQQCQLVYIELKTIYRQNEQRFIDLLNRIRHADPSDDDLDLLNNRYRIALDESKDYITLTSHNYKADKINQEQLAKLPGKVLEYKGVVGGEFPDKVLPTDLTLQLKVGAQVMFLRNDKSEERRYFNGKLATVTKINGDGVKVAFRETGEEILLEKENWENIKYTFNQSEGRIDSEVIGSFSQYPVRLAWAITIHKSQGLTFEHAIIDAGDSFAAGQVYVALSRCTSLDGLVLHSKLTRKSINTDERILSFANEEKDIITLQTILGQEREIFFNTQLLETFEVLRLRETFQNHRRYIADKIPDNPTAMTFAIHCVNTLQQLEIVSDKFCMQLEGFLREHDNAKIKERVGEATKYYVKFLNDNIVKQIDNHVTELKGTKKISKYLKRVRTLRSETLSKVRNIQSVKYSDVNFDLADVTVEIEAEPKILAKGKQKKGESVSETLILFEKGKSIEEISTERGFAVSTIETHLVQLVKEGKVEVLRVLSREKIDAVLSMIQSQKTKSVMALKQRLGEKFSFGEIRTVIAHVDLHGMK